MQTHRPKVLHHLAGETLLKHVITTAHHLQASALHVIVGHGAEQIQETMPDFPAHWVYQEQQLGTGHAVMQALPHIPEHAQVLILSGDVPLIQLETLQRMVQLGKESLTLLTANLSNPFGFGRISP